MKKLLFLCSLLLFIVVACSAPAEAEPSLNEADEPAVLAEEDTTYSNSVADFSIALPSEWVAAAATTTAFADLRVAAGNQADGLAFLSDAYVQGLIASGTELYALHLDSLNGDVPISLNISRGAAPVSISLDELVADTVAQLKDIVELNSDIEQTTVMLGEDEAIQISYSMQVKTAVGAETAVHNTQYYVVNDGNLYMITLAMGQDLVADYLTSSRAVAETFQVSTN